MQLTKDFHLDEFKCKDGTPVPAELIPNIQRLANNLQVLRDFVNRPIKVTSGYRTPEYNNSVGGVSGSQHPKAKASDIQIKGMSPRQVYNTIEHLISLGMMEQGGLGLYPNFTHYDVRGKKARW